MDKARTELDSVITISYKRKTHSHPQQTAKTKSLIKDFFSVGVLQDSPKMAKKERNTGRKL